MAAAADDRLTLALHAEEVTVSKRMRRTLVRAATTTSTRDEVVASDLERVQVVVDRFAIGRVVDAVPPVRVEGDVTIVSVVEEELVLVRRLVPEGGGASQDRPHRQPTRRDGHVAAAGRRDHQDAAR